MEDIILFIMAIVRLFCPSNDVPVMEAPKDVTPSSHVQATTEQHPVLSMSNEEFRKFVSAQNPHDPVKVEPDTVVHYPAGFRLDGKTSSSNSGEAAILSGDANFTGTTSDTGSTEVTPSTVPPAGYHVVKGYTTSKGTYVKPHLVRNSTSSSTSSTSSTSDWSTPQYTHSHDVQQRQQISQQNFPGQTLSSSDPTVIIGTH